MCAFGLSCETPAAPKPPGFHTTAPTKFNEKTQREREKEAGEGKKERNFGRSGGGGSSGGGSGGRWSREVQTSNNHNKP